MKLLLDQNLSRRLLNDIDAEFKGARHVADFDMSAADDESVWRFAADNGFVIISKDSDFFHKALLRGHPPKVIYLRVGNCSSCHIRSLLLGNTLIITEFIDNSSESLLILEG